MLVEIKTKKFTWVNEGEKTNKHFKSAATIEMRMRNNQ